MVNWYKRDPDRALNGMVGLTLEERGAYNTILDLLYSRDGVVPNDDAYLLAVLGCHGNQWRAVKKSLIAKGKIWVDLSGNLSGKRVEKTLKEAGNYSETQSKRATKGWEKRKKFNVINHPSMPSAAMPSGNASTPTPTPREEERASRALSSSTESPSLLTESERAPEGGSLASAVGGAPREPPSVDPPPDTTKDSKPESKRLTEEERAAQLLRHGIKPLAPKRMPDAPLSEPPLTRAESGRKSILELEKERKHAQSGNGRAGMEPTGSVVPASAGPGPAAPEPDVSQPEQPGIPALDGVLPKPNGQGSELHDASATVAPASDAAEPRAAWVKPKPLDNDYWDNIVNGN
jgi:uncharacterized protein YdaU (DUF1376 family)